MDLLVAFIIVGAIGYFIMTSDRSKPGCFAWCDVGKALLLWGLSETVVYLVKGPVAPVRVVNSIMGGGEHEYDGGLNMDYDIAGGAGCGSKYETKEDMDDLYGGYDSSMHDKELMHTHMEMAGGGKSIMSHVKNI